MSARVINVAYIIGRGRYELASKSFFRKLALCIVFLMGFYALAQDGQSLSDRERIAVLEANLNHLPTKADLAELRVELANGLAALETRLIYLILAVGAIGGVNICIGIRRNASDKKSEAQQ